MANGEWYYAQDNRQQGPVPLQAIQEMVRGGQIQPNTLVWRQGMPNWVTASQVPELFAPAVSQHPAPQAHYPYAPQNPPGGPYAPPTGAHGVPEAPYYPHPVTMGYAMAGKSYSGFAITSLVLSLIGLLFCGFIVGIAAIIFGVVALNGMNASGNREGRGMAIAGVVIGVLDILVGTVFAILMFGGVLAGA